MTRLSEVSQIYYIVDQNELYHHGVKGQRWGVRRYQKKDGSLTLAGRLHQNRLVNAYANAGRSWSKAQKRDFKINTRKAKRAQTPEEKQHFLELADKGRRLSEHYKKNSVRLLALNKKKIPMSEAEIASLAVFGNPVMFDERQ